jgi:predicted GNAT family acetyltransferase
MAGSDTPIDIAHTEADNCGAFFVERDGARIAEMRYARTGEDAVNIEHTRVDEQLRGLGVARRLLDAVVAWARETHTRVSATCPYARAQFERDASIRDVLVAS